MPEYSYRCRACRKFHDAYHSMHEDIPRQVTCSCGGSAFRVFTSPIIARWEEGYNESLGQNIGSRSQFKTALYEAQEKATERLGWQQSFVEKAPTRVSDKGLKETHDVRKTLGMST